MARVNPFWKNLDDGSDILAIFHGPNRYISPNWYPSKEKHGKVVPTWNYIVVHARGKVSWRHESTWLREHLVNSTKSYEAGDKPWKVSDAPPDYIQRMLGAIVGFEIAINELQGTWKLSQNRSEEDRQGVIDALSSQSNTNAADMVSWMNGERDRQ
jgi:transcriptional regulator